MNAGESVSALEQAHRRLVAELCPAAFPDAAGRPPVLASVDAERLRTLAGRYALDDEAAGYSAAAQRFLADVFLAAGRHRRAYLAARVALMEKARDTAEEQQGLIGLGFVETLLPVRLRRQIVHCLTTGPLLTRPLSEAELSELAEDAGLPLAALRARGDALPVLSEEEQQAVVGLLRALREGLEQVLEYQVRSRELADQWMQWERTHSLGALSVGVAHHFNNLLSVILGYASYVLNREKFSRQAREALQHVCEAAQRGRRMTEELLAFAGGAVEEDRPIHLHAVVSHVLSLLSSQAPAGLRTETRLAAEADEVLAPPSAVHQVVFNLLSNAMDSMPLGGQLTVATRNGEVNTGAGTMPCIQLQVTDSSGALPPGFRDRQEEPPEPSRLAPGDRAGLRLADVFGIVGRLDGTVRVDSSPGAWTRVEVALPLARFAGREAPPPPRRKRLAPSTIWVVDDDATFRQMCRVVLSEEGHAVEEVADGREMQKKWLAAPRPPDLLILDFSMPEYNGLELCQWLVKQGARVPVILVSGLSADQPDIHKALQMKRTYFLQKPFTMRELTDVVTVALGETLIGE